MDHNTDESIGTTPCRTAIDQFSPGAAVLQITPFGSGHIHDTFLARILDRGSERLLILQKINKTVFQEPDHLMDNLMRVTSFLRRKIAEAGGDPERETLTYLPAQDGRAYFLDPSGEYWRCCLFIGNSVSFDKTDDPDVFYQSALAFGRFQQLLSDFPVGSLYEPIKGFHDTAARLKALRQAVGEDVCGRASSVGKEIDFFLERTHLAAAFADLSPGGAIRLRVTHNDTKLNNVLFDKDTLRAVCVVDLDTVMPGLAMNDFGDAVRHGANTAEEDETDLGRVQLDLDLFKAFAEGFLAGCGGSLTDEEVHLLPAGAMVISYELGMRFLTDHLQGDVYFKTHRPDHNLDRARVQMALLQDMERKSTEMERVIDRLRHVHPRQ